MNDTSVVTCPYILERIYKCRALAEIEILHDLIRTRYPASERKSYIKALDQRAEELLIASDYSKKYLFE